MKRRQFMQILTQSGIAMGFTRTSAVTSQRKPTALKRSDGRLNFKDRGWVWEGQGIDPGVPPSIYGLGQGARYFGLSRVNYLFHPNDIHALRLLADYTEITCDISKWGWEWNEDGRPKCVPKSDPAPVKWEGENVARMAKEFQNITGVYCDDLFGLMRRYNYSPKEFGDIRSAIRDLNPDLNLWTVVYTHELEKVDFWTEMRPHIDVVTLWIWNFENIRHMHDYVDQCRELFPNKPIIMGVYLRDYTTKAPVPVDRVRMQMNGIADLIAQGMLAGYSILAAVLIDGHRPQADTVRDFIDSQ